MTVDDIFEQAQTLSPDERRQLAEKLWQSAERDASTETDDHWGKSLSQRLDELPPIEMKYPEIKDPVEWVKQIRRDARRRRLGDWGEQE